jgi:hypothetical protein
VLVWRLDFFDEVLLACVAVEGWGNFGFSFADMAPVFHCLFLKVFLAGFGFFFWRFSCGVLGFSGRYEIFLG